MSLDDLVALNDEIAGLVRAGVPLQLGLTSWGRDLPGGLGRTVTQLGQRIDAGQSLPQALEDPSADIPPVYRAIVRAGLKSGRLPAALESLATSARNLQQVRAALGLALLYPMIIVTLTYFLFVFLLVHTLPALLLFYDGRPPRFWQAMAGLGRWLDSEVPLPWTDRVIVLYWIPPLVCGALAWFWWRRTRRAVLVDAGAATRWLWWMPVAGRTVRHARAATLAELMGLLVEHGVPLDESVLLAAQATNDRQLMRSAELVAQSISAGGTPRQSWLQLRGFPPLLAWLMTSGGRQSTFAAVARHVADSYRQRMERDTQWLRDYLPMWLVLLVGMVVVLAYGITMYLPFSQLMQALGETFGPSIRIR